MAYKVRSGLIVFINIIFSNDCLITDDDDEDEVDCSLLLLLLLLVAVLVLELESALVNQELGIYFSGSEPWKICINTSF